MWSGRADIQVKRMMNLGGGEGDDGIQTPQSSPVLLCLNLLPHLLIWQEIQQQHLRVARSDRQTERAVSGQTAAPQLVTVAYCNLFNGIPTVQEGHQSSGQDFRVDTD